MSLISNLKSLSRQPEVVNVKGSDFTVYPLSLLGRQTVATYADKSKLERVAAILWLSLRPGEPSITFDDVLGSLDADSLVALDPVFKAIARLNRKGD